MARLLPRLPIALCTIFGLSSVVLLSSTREVEARPKRPGCGGQYTGNPYLDCNREQGREAIPEVCTRYYRNCDGVQVYLNTVCVGPNRGSSEHRVLLMICNALTPAASGGVYQEPDNDGPIPPDSGFDAVGFMQANMLDPVKEYPDVKTFDFADGLGPVAAHRHPNGRGVIADSVKLAGDPATIYIGPEARVFGNATIGRDVIIESHAQVYGDAIVTNGSFVMNEAHVFGKASLDQYAGALDHSTVTGNARLACGAMTMQSAVVTGVTTVDGYDPKGTSDDCGKGLAMSDKPGLVTGKATLACSAVTAGQVITSSDRCK